MKHHFCLWSPLAVVVTIAEVMRVPVVVKVTVVSMVGPVDE